MIVALSSHFIGLSHKETIVERFSKADAKPIQVCASRALALSALLLGALTCTAAELNGQQVVEVGTHANSNMAFFRVTGDLSECAYTTVYISLSTEGGRAAYATVLSARNSRLPLGRVAYSRVANGTCTLDLVSE